MLLKHLKNSLNTWGKPTMHKRTYKLLPDGRHSVTWQGPNNKGHQIYIDKEPDGTPIKCHVCGVSCLTAAAKYQRKNGDHKKRHTCTRKCQEELTRNHKYNPLVILKDEEGFYLDKSYGYMVRRVRKLRKNGKYKGRMHRVKEFMHRVVMEQHLGRKLTQYEHVHHIDMDKTNNDISNLLLCSPSDHMKVHHTFNELCEKMLKDGKIIFDDKTKKYNFNENYK